MLRALAASLLATAVCLSAIRLPADDRPPKKVALLVGVNKYLKPGFKDLQFAEADVLAVGEELTKLGFQVTILLGSGAGERQATRANIEAAAQKMVAPLSKRDVALVMLSGHGQQLHPDLLADPTQLDFDKTQSYYCPVDALVNRPETQFSLSHLVDEILAPNVGRKLLLVDACRDVPVDRSRGRNTKGIEGRVVALPEGTGVFFSCSAGQTSFENDDLRHGLFTYCVLEGLRGAAVSAGGELAWSRLVAHVDERMQQEELTRHMPERQRQVPIPAGALPYTVLGKLDVRPAAATTAPRPVATTPTPPAPMPAPMVPAGGVEGSRAGEVRTFTDLGIKFCWCPSGSFTMGSPGSEEGRDDDEAQVNVTLSRGFWLGQTEVTQGQWQSVMGTTPWAGKERVREGANYPATYLSWDDAQEFCRRMTERERAAGGGRQPAGSAYRLPTEAEWEYACRAGTTGPYNGDGTGVLSDYAWYRTNAWDVGEQYAHAVGLKKPNRWNLYDMHGNVWEWSRDAYQAQLPGGRDPVIDSSPENRRVMRGGGWYVNAVDARSADRGMGTPVARDYYRGFRVARTP